MGASDSVRVVTFVTSFSLSRFVEQGSTNVFLVYHNLLSVI